MKETIWQASPSMYRGPQPFNGIAEVCAWLRRNLDLEGAKKLRAALDEFIREKEHTK
jgi:hypothetical protein